MDETGNSCTSVEKPANIPPKRRRFRKVAFGLIVLLMVLGVGISIGFRFSNVGLTFFQHDAGAVSKENIDYVRPGWKVERLAQLPGEVYSICTHQYNGNDDVYVGAGKNAEVFRFNSETPQAVRRITTGFAEDPQSGTSVVTHLSIRDLFDDGAPKLIATVNQCVPVGKPWLFVVNLVRPGTILGVVRPDIASSWTHGIGYSKDKKGRDTILSTYCGHGEVVEFAMIKSALSDGYVADGLKYRQIGTMPGSGEYLQTIDLDGDDEDELIIASGYRPQQACLRFYKRFSKKSAEVAKQAFGAKRLLGEDWILIHEINERNRFGNVRFLAGKTSMSGKPSIIAWWCTELLGGKCEIVKYAFSNEGNIIPIRIAQGEAHELWPIDGQMALVDTDGDSMPEIWFATGSGNLWRAVTTDRPYAKAPLLTADADVPERVIEKQAGVRIFPGVSEFDLICDTTTNFGPIAAMPAKDGGTELLIGSGSDVLKISATQKSTPIQATRRRMFRGGPFAARQNSAVKVSPKQTGKTNISNSK